MGVISVVFHMSGYTPLEMQLLKISDKYIEIIELDILIHFIGIWSSGTAFILLRLLVTCSISLAHVGCKGRCTQHSGCGCGHRKFPGRSAAAPWKSRWASACRLSINGDSGRGLSWTLSPVEVLLYLEMHEITFFTSTVTTHNFSENVGWCLVNTFKIIPYWLHCVNALDKKRFCVFPAARSLLKFCWRWLDPMLFGTA